MKNQNSRETILNQALALFSARGYDAVSVNEIVEAAGITKPTLYYFFGSKEGLFQELLEQGYGALNKALEEVCRFVPLSRKGGEDVHRTLKDIALAFFSFAEEYTDFYLMSLALSFAPPTSHPARVAEEYHKNQYLALEEVFSEMGRIYPDVKGKELECSLRFLALVDAQIAFWCRGYVTLTQEDADTIVEQFLNGVFT